MTVRIIVVAIVVSVAGSACSTGGGSDATNPSSTSGLVLRPSGIGPFEVGDDAEEVIDGISSRIGGPDADSAEPNSPVEAPACDEGPARLVSWGSLALVFVGEGEDARFLTWSYGFDPLTGGADDRRGLGLTTAEGVGLGTPRPELERVYRGRIVVDDDPSIDIATFAIDADEAEHLEGRLPTTEPDAAVQLLQRVPACTPIGRP